jgi:MHS family alpha-ketoglutarate permease-like MFS transporter
LTTTEQTAPARVGKGRALAVASIGNALEWYDWNSYVVFAAVLGPQFFAKGNGASGLLETLAVFAVGFFFRPLGGALLGAFSDRHGRRAALTLSIILMAGGSLLIAVSPTYQAVGLLAPTLLVLARAMQGLSAGGEVTAMSTYVNELAPPGKRAFYSSAIYISTTVGTLLAVLLAVVLKTALTPAELAAWGWRIPFLLGALLGVYGWYLRRQIAESEIFTAGKRVRRPTYEVLVKHPKASLRVVGFTLGTTVVYYTFAVYLPSYAQRALGVPAGSAMWASVGAQVVFIAVLPFLGRLSDRIGRLPLLRTFGIGFTVLSPVLFGLLGPSAFSLFAVMAAALVLFACCAAAAPSAMLEMFPTEVRSAGIGLPYSLTVAVFGGTAPYVIEWLSARGSASYFPWYVAGLCLVSTVVFFAAKETKDVALDDIGTTRADAGMLLRVPRQG